MFIFEKNPKNLQKPVEYTRFDGNVNVTRIVYKHLNYDDYITNICIYKIL